MIFGAWGFGSPYILCPPGQYCRLSTSSNSSDVTMGIVGNNEDWTGYSLSVDLRFVSNFASAGDDHLKHMLGPSGINTWSKYFGIYGKRACWFIKPDNGVDISSYMNDFGWHSLWLKSGTLNIDGVSIAMGSGSWTSSGVWTSFSVGTTSNVGIDVCYRNVKLRDASGNLVFDLVPARDEDGNGAFYDKVSGKIGKASNASAEPFEYHVN